MSGYIGPIPVPQGIQNKETFTATAGQTTFNTNGYTDGAFINVYLNGVRLINGTDYTATNGSDIVLTQAASVSDVLDFETFNSFSLASQQFENITTKNPTHEDTDGGRESALSFQGEQSGGEISTLAQIQASHDGTSDDQKGDLIFKTNDGSDNNAPTERLRIDSNGSILTATLGGDNVHIGEGAGVSITSGGNNNVTIGKSAGTALTTGDNNVAVGYQALFTEDADGSSTAIGYRALKVQNAGATSYNTAVGFDAGVSITTGIRNTITGGIGGDALTTGSDNTVFGYNALTADTAGNKSVAIGRSALSSQNFTSSTDSQNTAVGYSAGSQVTTGTENVFLGHISGAACTTGFANTYLGRNAGGSTTSSYNTFIGTSSGATITTGEKNTVVGRYSGNQGGLDIRTSDNNIVLSDGDGNPIGNIHNSYVRFGVTQSFSDIADHSSGIFRSERNSITSSGNADDFKTSGFYRFDSGASGLPTSTHFYAMVIFGNSGNVTTQIAVQLQSTTSYVRSFNSAWSSWARLDT